MKTTDFIAEKLSSLGVRTVFGYQGGNIAHMINSISQRNDMEFVVTYNEQGASFSACGYALESEGLGVAMASSGPGAINMISGIANAYYDSIPCLFITGNVSSSTMKKNDSIRQNAFQENDIVSMVKKITKYAVTILDPHEVKYHLEKALFMANEGRPGPVLLDIPHNIQKADLDFTNEKGFSQENNQLDFSDEEIYKLCKTMECAERPLIIVGGGMNKKKSKTLLLQLLDKWNIPVVSTLRGLDVVSHELPHFIGFGGAYGNRSANYAIKYSDVILVLGARLDERFLATNDLQLFSKKKIFHVDIDKTELRRIIKDEVTILTHVDDFLTKILHQSIETIDREAWINLLKNWSSRYPSVDMSNKWNINNAVAMLTKNSSKDSIVSIDVGINQMCVAQAANLNGQKNCYTSAGHGAMGCALPIAIGASYANKNKLVDCYLGDGALHMNIQELLMLSRDKLPVHVILNNNQCLGMIRDFQTKAFDSNFFATVSEFNNIDYEKIAKAYNLNYLIVNSMSELGKAVEMINANEPCFVELRFDENVDTNPKLGSDLFKQLPLISDEEIEIMEKEVLTCGNTISW